MNLSLVDSSATKGSSPLHKTVPAAKLIAVAGLLVGVVVSTNVFVVATLALVLAGIAVAMRLEWRAIFALAAYPAVFAALFAFAAAPQLLAASLIVAKAVTAALSVILLLFTTPYPQVFAPLQRYVPAVVGDALLMTYRSLFLLLDKFSHTVTAARLRAGVVGNSPIRSATAMTRALGGVLLYSVDLSQRTHDVMHLRGYDGRLAVTPAPSQSRLLDAGVALFGLTIATAAVMWRMNWQLLNPYSWIPLMGGAAALLAGVAINVVSKDRS